MLIREVLQQTRHVKQKLILFLEEITILVNKDNCLEIIYTGFWTAVDLLRHNVLIKKRALYCKNKSRVQGFWS